jgi:phosphate:Na+ symporter
MSTFQTLILILATIALFLHGLEGFSREVREVGATYFKQWLSKVTEKNLFGFILGVALTALIQSSSAVSSITVALVDAGIISFSKSLAVMLGANVGTTSTAWLITFKIGQIAPFCIVIGTIAGIVPGKAKLMGKSIFYFGLILFSLDLISQATLPLKNHPVVPEILATTNNHLVGIVIGLAVTALVQSSSVTTGLSVILAQQGILTTDGAVAIIIGSNVGTTSTALIASYTMNGAAKLAARANFMFNLIGVVVCFPFINSLDSLAANFTKDIGFQVAFAHLFFNLIITVVMLPLLKPFGRWLQKRWGEHVETTIK